MTQQLIEQAPLYPVLSLGQVRREQPSEDRGK